MVINKMKYKIKTILEGEFPESPDIDTIEIDKRTWDKIINIIYPKSKSKN